MEREPYEPMDNQEPISETIPEKHSEGNEKYLEYHESRDDLQERKNDYPGRWSK